MHVLKFSKDGTFVTNKTVKEYIEKNSDEADIEKYDADMEGKPGEENVDELWKESIEALDIYHIISVGSFVVIQALPNSVKLFFVIKVSNKGIANENMMDKSGEHCLLKAKGTEDALIHISEVFLYDIFINNDLQMDIHEYRMLCCSVY